MLEAPYFQELEGRASRGLGGTCVSGLVDGSRALVLFLLAQRTRKPLMLVVPDDGALNAYRRDLTALWGMHGLDPQRVVVLPALDSDPYDDIPPHPEVLRERVVALDRLVHRRLDVLLLPSRALLSKLPSPSEWSERSRTIKVDDELPPDRFILQAIGDGYRRVDTVSAPGEVSRRGGIVDIFPPDADEPVRIELFGDTIDSLRAFDTDHQRSTGTLKEASIGPAMENPLTEDALERLASYLEGSKVRGDKQQRDLRRRLEMLRNEGYWPGLEALAGLTAERPVSTFDYAPGLMLVVDEPEKCEETLTRADYDMRRSYEESDNRVLPPPDELFGDPLQMRDRLRAPALMLQELIGDKPIGTEHEVQVASRSMRNFSGQLADLSKELRDRADTGARTICLMRASGSVERLGEIFEEQGLAAAITSKEGETPKKLPSEGGLFVQVGSLRAGFELPQQGLAVIAEREVFGEQKKQAAPKGRSHAAFLSDFRDLKVGDMLVHVDHGIARYAGLGRPKGGSLNRDFMLLEFEGRDKLFVPIDRLDLVQKYRGVGGGKPKLDKLGGPGWDKVKSKVRKSVENIAKQLMELYTRRQAARGYAFAADSAWQEELEQAFPYELTPDQKRTVEEVKADMESERPMDRLLVGDVGFGKTEVAVRAAFKAVMDGKQVAMLAPTTVLAAQHFDTLTRRYAPFPVKVEMVSRFRSAAETRETVKRVASGEVDVLVGTHRLLSKDVKFKDLGLLIVDEEQRFGVTHKERLKELSVGIDILSMTATPIPRTLQMSMAGVRDLSLIETPPPGRTAIQTFLIPFRPHVLAQAIRQEMRRDGQIFVVHDRIETLGALVQAIQELVPEARILSGHGQMGERRLEEVMTGFCDYEADVLVTTSIIENGLDIPRANTIIVNQADNFGLAQLYQLRGRVGRSAQHAYCYFVIPGKELLSDAARKRLRALQEFSELGAGFRLAAADLEIRGAGEFLGTKQHGHIASLGFDLYVQMLERAVGELKGESPPPEQRPSLHLGVDIKLPDSYLEDAGDRLALYKRLASARTDEDVRRISADTEDRYGHLPAAGSNLFEMAHLRLLAEQAGVKSIDIVEGKMQIRFHETAPLEPHHLLELMATQKGRLTPSGMLVLPAPGKATQRMSGASGVLKKLLGIAAA
ncbi:hypothetical protein ABI59_14785 [Acidobacteria bacterium Mor1]|nr:hypothetical protein ABI59_14785 [Acidobacteria bacterium Mor1]